MLKRYQLEGPVLVANILFFLNNDYILNQTSNVHNALFCQILQDVLHISGRWDFVLLFIIIFAYNWAIQLPISNSRIKIQELN